MIDRKLLYLKPKEVRVIDEEGKQLGVFPFEKAGLMAQEKNLDLMLVGERAQPPVVKLGDMKRIRYELEKKKTKTKVRDLKQIRLGVNESPYSVGIKMKKGLEFLEKGHPVLIQVRMKGRQKAHADFAREKLKKIMDGIEVPHKIIQDIKGTPNGLTVVISK